MTPLAASLALAPLLAAAEPPNLLLVTIDTLRADRVGAYGHAAAHTPALDRLAREGVLVEEAVVQVPQTRPSHASIFTGRLPYEHGIRDNASPPLDAALPTLAQLLRGRGYATGGFVGAYPVSRDSGLDRGFAHFDDPFASGAPGRQESRSERRADEVVDRALEWLGAAPRPFFAWVHLFDPHAPYEPPASWRERLQDRYDGEVAFADSQLGRLLEWLDARSLSQSTLVVVTSDHGEGLGDHGEEEHLLFVYDTTLRVPLLLRWPGQLPAAVRVAGQFRSVDLMPTLLELLQAPAAPASGLSRAGELRRGAQLPDNQSYAESLYGELHFGYAPLRALRAEGWKYIHAPRAELYHLREDPGEARNRLDDRANVAVAMQQRLLSLDRSDPRAAAARTPSDAAADERLAALGYVGGGFFSGTPSGADPKDQIDAFQLDRREVTAAVRLFTDGRYLDVVKRLEPLTRPSRDERGRIVERYSYNVSFYLGRSLMELGRHAEAVPHLEQAARLSPGMPTAWAWLSSAQAAAGLTDAALATADRGLKVAPHNAELRLARGRLLMEKGRSAEARAALEEALRLAPESAAAHAALADLRRSQGELAAALAGAERAVRLAPEWAAGRLSLGLALAAAGREAEGGEALREALRLDPRQPEALFYLAAIERRAGRPREALPLLERLLQRAPEYPGAREALEATRSALAPAPAGSLRLRLLRVATRALAEAALDRLRRGEHFDALARELSIDASAAAGGALGAVPPADLSEALRVPAEALQPGQVSGVVALGESFALLMREP